MPRPAPPGARARACAVRPRTRPLLAALLLLLLPCAASPAVAQTSSLYSNLANPAIGMNGLFSGSAAPNLNQPYGLSFDEAELSLVSAVDPYWTFSGNLVFAGDGTVDAEEIWARNTRVPGLQLTLGKLRGAFGKQGLLHTHAFPFIQAPVVMANTIGGEGFQDAGVEAAWLAPFPWYSELTAGAYHALAGGADQPLDLGSARHDNVPALGHWRNLVDLSDATTLELGQSWLQGRGADGARHDVLGADLTVHNVPARSSNRRGWILQGEYLQAGATAGGRYARGADGGYASLQYRLSQVWWVGVRGERARRSLADFVVDAAGAALPADVRRLSVNLAWAPSEFSFVRLEYAHATADAGVHPGDDRLLLQLSYTIGHHPAHPY